MAYYDALIAKWATLPAVTTGADVTANLATLNAMTVPGTTQPVAIIDAVTYLREQNAWLAIKAAAPTNPAAEAAVDLNDDIRATTVDFSLPGVRAMIDALVTSGYLTTAQSAALIAMGATAVPWWEASIADTGAALSSPINVHDLIAAGVIAEQFAKDQGVH